MIKLAFESVDARVLWKVLSRKKADCSDEAAEIWNGKQIGVKFEWVGKLEDAAFVLAYGGDGGRTLARAFFPNNEDLNTMFVYQKAFDQDYVSYVSNILQHELGHVLGLRHEFAPEREGGAVLWGTRNPRSVMSYVFPPEIQPSDEEDTKTFYALPGGSIGLYLIKDEVPNN